jgi:addiction module HigA family antidote
LSAYHSIRINSQWRIIFIWDDAGAHDVKIVDYHKGDFVIMKKPRIPHPTLPGEMLTEEFLVPLGLTQTELAQKIGVAPRSINEICKGKRAISPLMAMRLADVFDNTPEFWMNLQSAWDLWKEWEKSQRKRSA